MSDPVDAANAFNQTGGQIVVAKGATLTLAGTAQFGPYGTGEIDGPGTLATTGTTTLDENVYIGAGLTWSNSGTVDDVTDLIGRFRWQHRDLRQPGWHQL